MHRLPACYWQGTVREIRNHFDGIWNRGRDLKTAAYRMRWKWRGRIREANERVVVGGHAPHKNSWRFLSEFRGRSCDALLFCNRRLIICCLLKQRFQKGHWWFRNDTKKKYEGAVTRHSEAFWSKPGKETRKTGWSSDSIEKNHPLIRSLRAVVKGVSKVNARMGQGR